MARTQGPTQQQIAMMRARQQAANQTRDLKLYLNHPTQHSTASNAAGIISPIVRFRPENNSFFALPRILYPILKLYKSDGNQIDPSSVIVFGKQMPGEDVYQLMRGVVPYLNAYDLTTSEQASKENRGPGSTMEFDLGEGAPFREEEELVIFLKSPDVVDLTQTGSRIDFTVKYRVY